MQNAIGSAESCGTAKGVNRNPQTSKGTPDSMRWSLEGSSRICDAASAPSVMKTGISRSLAKGATPRQWSPCSCDTTIAEILAGFNPSSLSLRAVSLALSPISTRMCTSPLLTTVAFPELPLPSKVKLSPIGSDPQRHGVEGAAVAASQAGNGQGGCIENLACQPPDVFRSNLVDSFEDLLQLIKPSVIDLLLRQVCHPGARALETEHHRAFDVVFAPLQLVRRHKLLAQALHFLYSQIDHGRGGICRSSRINDLISGIAIEIQAGVYRIDQA